MAILRKFLFPPRPSTVRYRRDRRSAAIEPAFEIMVKEGQPGESPETHVGSKHSYGALRLAGGPWPHSIRRKNSVPSARRTHSSVRRPTCRLADPHGGNARHSCE